MQRIVHELDHGHSVHVEGIMEETKKVSLSTTLSTHLKNKYDRILKKVMQDNANSLLSQVNNAKLICVRVLCNCVICMCANRPVPSWKRLNSNCNSSNNIR